MTDSEIIALFNMLGFPKYRIEFYEGDLVTIYAKLVRRGYVNIAFSTRARNGKIVRKYVPTLLGCEILKKMIRTGQIKLGS